MSTKTTKGWRWGNFPVPESHLVLIVLGVVLDVLWPIAVGTDSAWIKALGVILICLGVGGIVWATSTVGGVDLSDPDRLITTGPYELSRHPMYVAWTLIYLGVAMILDSAWLVLLAPVLSAWIHWETNREEKRMIQSFGPAYDSYRGRVRRYL